MKDALTVFLAVIAGLFSLTVTAAWMAVLPTIGLLWLTGFLK